MSLCRPTVCKTNIFDITPQLLSSLGVKALLLDVDNTIAEYTSHRPLAGAVNWAKSLEQAGFQVIIVSNNYERRVSAFAKEFGLPWISFALKPFPFGYLKARKKLGRTCGECAIIGDQIFTDIVGANLCGMKSVLLSPIQPEDGVTFKIRRYFERGLREKYRQPRK